MVLTQNILQSIPLGWQVSLARGLPSKIDATTSELVDEIGKYYPLRSSLEERQLSHLDLLRGLYYRSRPYLNEKQVNWNSSKLKEKIYEEGEHELKILLLEFTEASDLAEVKSLSTFLDGLIKYIVLQKYVNLNS